MPKIQKSEEEREAIRQAWRRNPKATAGDISREMNCDPHTAKRYKAQALETIPLPPTKSSSRPTKASLPSMPMPLAEAGGPQFPEPVECSYEPMKIDTPGDWLVMSDIHIPYHDRKTIETAIREAKDRSIKGIILDGDILDFYQLSRFSKRPDKPRMREEIEKGRQFLDWLRSQFPHARIIFKEGNHDERLGNYLLDKAPDLFDLEDMQLPSLLRADDFGVEWVGDKRVIELGKLCVIHGHEYRGSGGVMPARWLFIRAWSNAMLGHFHQPTYYTVPTLDRRELGVWSLGCCCYLYPSFMPQNSWRHGFAHVKLDNNGTFEVVQRAMRRDGMPS